MNVYRREPYLWIHLAGVALVPLCLEAVWLGFALSNSLLPFWLELGLVGAIGCLPVWWMQWQRPFDIFSLLLVSIKPEKLSRERQQLLSALKTPRQRVICTIAAIALLVALWPLDRYAPLAATALPAAASSWSVAGIALAAIAFLSANLFGQVPASVVGVLLVDPEKLAAIAPMSPERVPQAFTIPGLRVDRLPGLEAPTPPPAVTTENETPTPSDLQATPEVETSESESASAATSPTNEVHPEADEWL